MFSYEETAGPAFLTSRSDHYSETIITMQPGSHTSHRHFDTGGHTTYYDISGVTKSSMTMTIEQREFGSFFFSQTSFSGFTRIEDEVAGTGSYSTTRYVTRAAFSETYLVGTNTNTASFSGSSFGSSDAGTYEMGGGSETFEYVSGTQSTTFDSMVVTYTGTTSAASGSITYEDEGITYTLTYPSDSGIGVVTETLSHVVPTTTTYSSTSSVVTSSGTAGTQSTSYSYTNKTSTYMSGDLTGIGYTSGTATNPVMLKTHVVAESTDWLWVPTTTGSGQVSDICQSFTETIFSPAVSVLSSHAMSIEAFNDQNSSSANGTSYNFNGTTTVTSTKNVLVTQTFTTATPTIGNVDVPLPSSTTATIEVFTSTATTLTYNATTSGSYTHGVYPGDEMTTTFSASFSTTATNEGTITGSTSYVVSGYAPDWYRTLISIATGDGTTFVTDIEGYSASPALTFGYSMKSVSTSYPGRPNYLEPAIGSGFQLPFSYGPGKIWGSNFAGTFEIQSFASVAPGLVIPILDGETRAVTIGTTPYTTQYVPSESAIYTTTSSTNVLTTRDDVTGSFTPALVGTSSSMGYRTNNGTGMTFGGFGWDSTVTATHLSQSAGIHRVTHQDSDMSTSTTRHTWSGTVTQRTIPRKAAEALEPDVLAVSPADGGTIYLSFSAFGAETPAITSWSPPPEGGPGP